MAGFTRLAAVAATAAVVAWAGYGVSAFATNPPPQPDLTVFSVGVSGATVGAGSAKSVSFIVSNSGAGDATEPWTDTLYLSADATLDGGDVALANISRSSNVAAGDSYNVVSVSVTVPVDTAPGIYYVLVQTDAGNVVAESDETNNVTASANSFNVGGPDLTMLSRSQGFDGGGSYWSSPQIQTSASFVAAVGAGSPIEVDYQVQNAGLGVASQPWSNQVWLSRDNHLDSGDTLLDTFTQTYDLPGNTGEGIVRAGILIPVNTPPGAYKLIVVLDSGDQVVEQPSVDGGTDGNANNTIVEPNAFNVGGPDLTMALRSQGFDSGGSYWSSPQIQTTANFVSAVGAGSPIEVDYQVQNAGLGIASQPWTNQIWLSRDNHLDSGDTLLDTFTQTSNMVGNSTFAIIRAGLVIPANTPPGAYKVIVVLDTGDQVLEQPSVDGGADGNANNTITEPNAFNVGGPDLTMASRNQGFDSGGSYWSSPLIQTTANFVSAVGAGSPIEVDYQVQNAGLGIASQPWTNQIWLSRDNHLDSGDTLLDTFTQTSNMVGNSTFAIIRAGVLIPVNTPPGAYKVIVKLDSGDQVLEQPSVDAGADGNANNTVTEPNAFNIGGPDLTLSSRIQGFDSGGSYWSSTNLQTSANFVAAAGAGSPIEVDLQVQNAGLGVASQPWTDQIWLSRDNHLDSGDVLLDTFTQTSNMVGNSLFVIIRAGVVIPVNTPPGAYKVIVVVDSGDQVLEQPSVDAGADGNANNIVTEPNAFNVGGPDLTLSSRIQGFDSGGSYWSSTNLQTSANGASAVSAGSSIEVDYQVQNAGLGIASQPWTNQIWLSRDNHLDSGDTLLDTFTQTSNMVGNSLLAIIRAGVLIPVNTPPGAYKVIVKLDSGDQVLEQPSVDAGADGNANNTVTEPDAFNIGAPDLQAGTPAVGLASGTTSVVPGGNVSVAYTVTNGGTGIAVQPWDDKIYLSADGVLDPGDPLVGTVTHTSSLPGGSGNTYSVAGQSVTIPAATATGTYHLIVAVDGGNVVTESDETNNTGVSAGFAVASVTVAPPTLPAPVLDAPYSQSVTASGGTSPYTFSVSSGFLPSGLTLNAATGAVTGTTHTPGPYSFTLLATDANGATGTQSYSGTVADIALSVGPAAIPHATQGAPYSQTLTASGGNGTYAFDVSAGALPSGITLSAAGTIAGTTTAHGSFSFTARATDGNGRTGTQAYTLIVDYPAITVGPSSLPDGSIAHAYSQTLTASGGTAPYTFAVTAGALPAGVTLATGGVLSGTPTASGPFAFTVTATDANGAPGQLAYTLSIAADTTAPISTINATPAPPASGWNTANVTVTITATDDVSGVHEIDYSATGAQSIPATTVPGASASFVISTDGSTTITYHAVDNASNSEAPKTLTIKLDKTNPVVVCAAADAAWHGSNVSLACTAHDDASGLASAADAAFTLSTTVASGATNANASTGSRSVCDTAGHCVTAGPIAGNKIDRQAPAITLTKPTSGAVYTVGQAVAASYSCLDAGVGGGTCTGTVANGANINTTSTGTKTFTVTATDALGNTTTTSVTYSVSYPFAGFYGISNTGLNSVEAGDPVLLAFSLGGNRGSAIFAAGQPTSLPINCSTRAVLGASSPTSGTLAYGPITGLYGYRWNTTSAWKNTCRRFSMTLADGTTHTADFKLEH